MWISAKWNFRITLIISRSQGFELRGVDCILNESVFNEYGEPFTSIPSHFSSDQKLKWSYLQGKVDIPLLGRTIGQVVDVACEKCPDKTAVVFPQQNVRLTFSQLRNEVFILHLGRFYISFFYCIRESHWLSRHWRLNWWTMLSFFQTLYK